MTFKLHSRITCTRTTCACTMDTTISLIPSRSVIYSTISYDFLSIFWHHKISVIKTIPRPTTKWLTIYFEVQYKQACKLVEVSVAGVHQAIHGPLIHTGGETFIQREHRFGQKDNQTKKGVKRIFFFLMEFSKRSQGDKCMRWVLLTTNGNC